MKYFNISRPVTEEMLKKSSLLHMIRYAKLPYYEILSGKQDDQKQLPVLTKKMNTTLNKNVSLN